MTQKIILIPILMLLLFTQVLAGGDEGKEKKGSHCLLDIESCLKMRAEEMNGAAWDGIQVEGLGPGQEILVFEVTPDSPADKVGIKKGDYLLALDGKRMVDWGYGDLVAAMAEIKVGQKVTYTISRNGKELEMPLVMTRMPGEIMAQYIGKHMLWYHTDIWKDRRAKRKAEGNEKK